MSVRSRSRVRGPRTRTPFRRTVSPGRALLALADGMGGEKSGRAAADTALDALRANLPIRSVDERPTGDSRRRSSRLQYGRGGPGPVRRNGRRARRHGPDERRRRPRLDRAHVGDVRILSRSPGRGAAAGNPRPHAGLLALGGRRDQPRRDPGQCRREPAAARHRTRRRAGRDLVPAGSGWSWVMISDGVYKAMRLDELAQVLSSSTADEVCAAIRRKVDEAVPTTISPPSWCGPWVAATAIVPCNPPAEMTLESPREPPAPDRAGAWNRPRPGPSRARARRCGSLDGARDKPRAPPGARSSSGCGREVDSLPALMAMRRSVAPSAPGSGTPGPATSGGTASPQGSGNGSPVGPAPSTALPSRGGQ